MDIEKQFNMIAEEYDSNRRRFIPCFDDLYDNTTSFIASNIKPPKGVIDLGAGTGLLTYFWYKQFREANFLLVDIADEMLSVAKRRFRGISNISYLAADYKNELPDDMPFDSVISALSLHHLENGEKGAIFERIYKALPEGGIFVNYDQFCAGSPEMDKWYDSYWENQLYNSGLKDRDIELWKQRRILDHECSVETQTDMLKKCGFRTVKCVYSYQKFAVIIAVK